MNPQNFERVLKQVKPLTEEVCLHLMGEPLAHPEFPTILQICNQYQVPVQITTNGILLKKLTSVILESSCIRQINYSVQSYKDNFPNKDLTPYLKELVDFSRLCMNQRPEVYINFRLWNIGRTEPFSPNEEVIHYLEKSFDLSIKREVDLGSIKSKKLLNRTYLHFDSHFNWPSLNLPFQGKQGKCHALTGHIGIHADGTVVPCCLDKEAQIPLGNCLEKSLMEILESERATKMKEGFFNGILVEKLCQHCDYIKRFKKRPRILGPYARIGEN